MTEAETGKLKASEFHLSWNNYEASLASFLRVLTSAEEGEEALYDVTISCSGGKLFQVLLISAPPELASHPTVLRPTGWSWPPAQHISELSSWVAMWWGPPRAAWPIPSSTSQTSATA